jgi:hypothetical protein
MGDGARAGGDTFRLSLTLPENLADTPSLTGQKIKSPSPEFLDGERRRTPDTVATPPDQSGVRTESSGVAARHHLSL